jgi:hypothetical protein
MTNIPYGHTPVRRPILATAATLLSLVVAVGSCEDDSPVDCVFEGRKHAASESFKTRDGCNTCTCGTAGSVNCTQMICAVDGAAPPTPDAAPARDGGAAEGGAAGDGPRDGGATEGGTAGDGPRDGGATADGPATTPDTGAPVDAAVDAATPPVDMAVPVDTAPPVDMAAPPVDTAPPVDIAPDTAPVADASDDSVG